MTITRSIIFRLPLMLGAMAAGVFFSGAVGAQTQCYEDWSVSAGVVKERGLVSIEDLSKRAKVELGGTILKTRLCNTKLGFVYQVVVRTAGGRLETKQIDARDPFSDNPKER